jgi:hypothetical protein
MARKVASQGIQRVFFANSEAQFIDLCPPLRTNRFECFKNRLHTCARFAAVQKCRSSDLSH